MDNNRSCYSSNIICWTLHVYFTSSQSSKITFLITILQMRKYDIEEGSDFPRGT